MFAVQDQRSDQPVDRAQRGGGPRQGGEEGGVRVPAGKHGEGDVAYDHNIFLRKGRHSYLPIYPLVEVFYNSVFTVLLYLEIAKKYNCTLFDGYF